MKKTDGTHRCQTCGAKHRYPKYDRVLVALAWCAVLTAVQVLAALALDGWLAWAMWAVASRNVFIAVLLIVGLAKLADDADKEARR